MAFGFWCTGAEMDHCLTKEASPVKKAKYSDTCSAQLPSPPQRPGLQPPHARHVPSHCSRNSSNWRMLIFSQRATIWCGLIQRPRRREGGRNWRISFSCTSPGFNPAHRITVASLPHGKWIISMDIAWWVVLEDPLFATFFHFFIFPS
jgi:hypothetical protein